MYKYIYIYVYMESQIGNGQMQICGDVDRAPQP